MVNYYWPSREEASVLGTEQNRVDGLQKSTGAAKYAYDMTPKNMLFAKLLGSPHAHCKIKSLDFSAAKKVAGVVVARTMERIDQGSEVHWQGEPLAVVAAESNAAATEGLAAIKVEYELLDVFVLEENLEAAKKAGRTKSAGVSTKLQREPGDDDDEEEFEEQEIARLLKESHVLVEGHYGIHPIAHCCLETHGSTAESNDNKILSHLSTQNVSGTPGQIAGPLGLTADDVTVHCDFIGGGFGSKFAADTWGVEAARIAKETGRPVKLMLDRDLELKIAGCRPSGFVDIKVGADENGVVQVWDSHLWGTSGFSGGGVSRNVVPYVFSPPNTRSRATSVRTNAGPVRAWRAPNHPQGCAISQTMFDDVARKLGLDSYDVFMANLPNVSNGKADVYAAEMEIAAKAIGWKQKWHTHGKGPVDGSIVSGLGMALHTWGGGGHNSSCLLKIHPDGGVETSLGSQDLGTGTRTVIAMVVAETFGLPVESIKVNIGSSSYPASGPSGGSTTVGGVSESNRRASQDALALLFEKVAPHLKAQPGELEAKAGRIQVKGDPSRSTSWKRACSTLGMTPLEVQGSYRRGGAQSPLSSSGVAGVQMAEVQVDKDTGVVRVKKYVSVQDIGLIINRKTAASQILGAAIMGIAYALYEQRIMDPNTGAFVNAELADYKLPRLGDIGDIVVEFYEPDSERKRGVIGLGEPPVISPGAAISNAVCNALGVRVPTLPMTPKRVLDAINQARRA